MIHGSMTIYDDQWWRVMSHCDPWWSMMILDACRMSAFRLLYTWPDFSLRDPGHSFRKLKTMNTVKLKHWTICNMEYALCRLVAILMLKKRIISTMNDGGDGIAMVLMIAIMCQRPKLIIYDRTYLIYKYSMAHNGEDDVGVHGRICAQHQFCTHHLPMPLRTWHDMTSAF